MGIIIASVFDIYLVYKPQITMFLLIGDEHMLVIMKQYRLCLHAAFKSKSLYRGIKKPGSFNT